ncbi:MAG: PDZ domain-containing protein [Planctomycetaceae bacterium]|nr:PDZ domain-containing protein [Planctomycetaceae bacterium]
MPRSLIATGCILFIAPLLLAAPPQSREQKVRADKQRVEAEGFWIYNDLEKGFEEARKTGKPMLVVLRCLPCEECVKLDDELVEKDPVIRPLLDRFVCVRVVGTNGLDLSLFQYDTDQSFAVFLLNADRTIYGRFGTRSHRTEWVGDVSLKGMAAALQGALDLHAGYPANKASLSGKTGPTPEFSTPEKFPSLRDKFTSTLNYEGNVVQSCIHCHQIGDAQREFYRAQGQPIPETVLFPYPHPKSIGLVLDPHEKATIAEVTPDSPAAKAGFLGGDEIISLNGQPLLSMADVQWVLHRVPAEGGQVAAVVRRKSAEKPLTMSLASGWRRASDIEWRVTSWGLRRMALGGLKLEELTDEERKAASIPNGKMALRVQHVGQYGEHAAAKRAGVQKNDILIGFDGRDDLTREQDIFFHATTKKKLGDQVAIKLMRDGKTQTLKIPMQK